MPSILFNWNIDVSKYTDRYSEEQRKSLDEFYREHLTLSDDTLAFGSASPEGSGEPQDGAADHFPAQLTSWLEGRVLYESTGSDIVHGPDQGQTDRIKDFEAGHRLIMQNVTASRGGLFGFGSYNKPTKAYDGLTPIGTKIVTENGTVILEGVEPEELKGGIGASGWWEWHL